MNKSYPFQQGGSSKASWKRWHLKNSMVLTDGAGRGGHFRMRKQHVQKSRDPLVTQVVQLQKEHSQSLSSKGLPLASTTYLLCLLQSTDVFRK